MFPHARRSERAADVIPLSGHWNPTQPGYSNPVPVTQTSGCPVTALDLGYCAIWMFGYIYIYIYAIWIYTYTYIYIYIYI